MSQQTDGSLITAGTTVSVLTTVPSTWTEVEGVRDIGGAGHDRPLIRKTDLKDTVEAYALGRKDGSEITMTCRIMWTAGTTDLVPGQKFLRDHYDSGDPVTLKVAYPNSTSRTFDALVRSWPEAVNDGEFLTVEIGLKVVSDITRDDNAAA